MHLSGLASVGSVWSNGVLHLPCCLCLLPFRCNLCLALPWIYIPFTVYVSFFKYLSDLCDYVWIIFCQVFFAIYILSNVIQLYWLGRVLAVCPPLIHANALSMRRPASIFPVEILMFSLFIWL